MSDQKSKNDINDEIRKAVREKFFAEQQEKQLKLKKEDNFMGKYELLLKIKDGQVWLAQDTQKNDKVIIKLNQNDEKYFLTLLDGNKNIVSMRDGIKKENKEYIVIEFCCYGSLQNYMQNIKSLNLTLEEDVIIEFFLQIVEGVKLLHKHPKQKIIHRDLKSSNIYVDYDNVDKNPVIKIGDFGDSKQLEQNQLAKSSIGTYNVMAPELLENWGAKDLLYDTPVDIWALGVLLYEMMFSQNLFGSSSDRESLLSDIKNKLGLLSNQNSITQDPEAILQFIKIDPDVFKQHENFKKLFQGIFIYDSKYRKDINYIHQIMTEMKNNMKAQSVTKGNPVLQQQQNQQFVNFSDKSQFEKNKKYSEFILAGSFIKSQKSGLSGYQMLGRNYSGNDVIHSVDINYQHQNKEYQIFINVLLWMETPIQFLEFFKNLYEQKENNQYLDVCEKCDKYPQVMKMLILKQKCNLLKAVRDFMTNPEDSINDTFVQSLYPDQYHKIRININDNEEKNKQYKKQRQKYEQETLKKYKEFKKEPIFQRIIDEIYNAKCQYYQRKLLELFFELSQEELALLENQDDYQQIYQGQEIKLALDRIMKQILSQQKQMSKDSQEYLNYTQFMAYLMIFKETQLCFIFKNFQKQFDSLFDISSVNQFQVDEFFNFLQNINLQQAQLIISRFFKVEHVQVQQSKQQQKQSNN